MSPKILYWLLILLVCVWYMVVIVCIYIVGYSAFKFIFDALIETFLKPWKSELLNIEAEINRKINKNSKKSKKESQKDKASQNEKRSNQLL